MTAWQHWLDTAKPQNVNSKIFQQVSTALKNFYSTKFYADLLTDDSRQACIT